MPTDHNIRQLIINKLTDEQYEQAVKNADELYLTPDSGSGGGTDLPDQTGQSGKFLTTNGSTLSWANVPTGTVTSVRVQATSPVQSSTSTAQSTTLNTTISLANGYGDTKNPYGTKTANYVLAGPSSGSAAAPTFRALVKEDIPLASEIATSGGTTTSLVTTGEKYIWDNKQDAISDLSTIRDGASAGATAVQPSDLATVATSGSYNDLLDKPTIDTALSTTSTNAAQNKIITTELNKKIQQNDILQDLNPHALQPRYRFFSSTLNNVLYRSDKRHTVTLTNFNTSNSSTLFDMNFDSNIRVLAGKIGTVNITGSTYNIGMDYPYGWLYVSFYGSNGITDLSQISAKVYQDWSGHNTGWVDITNSRQIVSSRNDNGTTRIYTVSFYTQNYGLRQIEISIDNTNGVGKEDTNVWVTQIEFFCQRTGVGSFPILTKLGGTVNGNLTIPTTDGSFIGNLTGTASRATADADGNTISTTYLKSHQSIKSLKTDNTTAQTASSSEAITGSGTINLHKVSKTGSYNDLLNTPTIPVITDTYSATSSDGMSGKAVASAISNKADKATSLSGYGITDAYTKTEIDGMVSAGMHFKGTVASYSNLPTTGNKVGDMWNVTDTGANYAWDGTAWDKLSENVDLSGYVPTSRTINNKALTGNISLTASDVGALPDSTTIPQGTVKSVRVQAGTGLSSSTSTAQTETLNTTISIASGYKLPTTTEWGNKQDALTTQTAYTSKGTATKVPQITTNTLGQVTGITEVDITQPTVNNSTILLTQGGVNKGSFTLNQATDSIIDFDKSGAELIIVDNSGSILPTPQTIGETFLNTTDKKIYTAEAGEYVLGDGIVNNGNLDISTGEISGFTTTKYLSGSARLGTVPINVDIHFKTGLDVTTKQGIMDSFSFNSSTHATTGRGNITIEEGVLKIQGTQVCSVQTITDYHIIGTVTLAGSSTRLTISVKENNIEIVSSTMYSFNYPTTSSSNYLVFGVFRGSQSTYSNPFLGTLYGNTIWKDTILVSEGETGWNNGTALTNDAICQDETNKITYLYQNNNLISINELPNQSGQSGKYLTTNGTTVSWATVSSGAKFLSFTNVSASNWVSDNTYSEYGYKCVLTCNGVTSNDFAYVVFSPTEFNSGNYANVCLTGTNSVTIYSKVTDTITILTIAVMGA